jgi:hypothetical protein
LDELSDFPFEERPVEAFVTREELYRDLPAGIHLDGEPNLTVSAASQAVTELVTGELGLFKNLRGADFFRPGLLDVALDESLVD